MWDTESGYLSTGSFYMWNSVRNLNRSSVNRPVVGRLEYRDVVLVHGVGRNPPYQRIRASSLLFICLLISVWYNTPLCLIYHMFTLVQSRRGQPHSLL